VKVNRGLLDSWLFNGWLFDGWLFDSWLFDGWLFDGWLFDGWLFDGWLFNLPNIDRSRRVRCRAFIGVWHNLDHRDQTVVGVDVEASWLRLLVGASRGWLFVFDDRDHGRSFNDVHRRGFLSARLLLGDGRGRSRRIPGLGVLLLLLVQLAEL
jgi:hypothetical protein